MPPDAQSVVGDLMRRWPATMGVFLRHRMLCIGCPIARFHTVARACAEHGMEREPFLGELRAAAAGSRAADDAVDHAS